MATEELQEIIAASLHHCIEVQQILARLNFYVRLECCLFLPIKLYLPPTTYLHCICECYILN